MIVQRTTVKRTKMPDGSVKMLEESVWYDTEADARLTRPQDIERARYAYRIPRVSLDRIMDAYLEDFEDRHCGW